jgi:hypothetical protein
VCGTVVERAGAVELKGGTVKAAGQTKPRRVVVSGKKKVSRKPAAKKTSARAKARRWMRRNMALLLIIVGTTLFGMATGFVYMDQRQMELHAIKSKAGETSQAPDTQFVARAMLLGPIGAGLVLAGIALVVMELRWFRPLP